MVKETYDKRVNSYRPLLSPTILKEEIPMPPFSSELVNKARQSCENVILGKDPRLLVITGPCSIHDCNAAIDYAHKLNEIQKTFSSSLVIVMRVYFEKTKNNHRMEGFNK